MASTLFRKNFVLLLGALMGCSTLGGTPSERSQGPGAGVKVSGQTNVLSSGLGALDIAAAAAPPQPTERAHEFDSEFWFLIPRVSFRTSPDALMNITEDFEIQLKGGPQDGGDWVEIGAFAPQDPEWFQGKGGILVTSWCEKPEIQFLQAMARYQNYLSLPAVVPCPNGREKDRYVDLMVDPNLSFSP